MFVISITHVFTPTAMLIIGLPLFRSTFQLTFTHLPLFLLSFRPSLSVLSTATSFSRQIIPFRFRSLARVAPLLDSAMTYCGELSPTLFLQFGCITTLDTANTFSNTLCCLPLHTHVCNMAAHISGPGSDNINLAAPEVEKVQRKIVAVQVHQVDSKDERRRIHSIRLEIETNSWTIDASIEPAFFKCGLCRTGKDIQKVCQVSLRIANSEHLEINIWVPTVIWHLAALSTIS
jgi:hypothetical protein